MTDVFATLNDQPVLSAVVHVPQRGPWFADVDMETDPGISGSARLVLGALELVGTVDASSAGTFGRQRRLRLVAGAGGWATLLPPKDYHNDAGVRASIVADEAARLTGESFGAFSPASDRIGVDYVREAGPASRVLEDVIGDVPWWVDYAGATQVGARSTSTPASGSYQVLEHDPRSRVVTLAVDDLRAVVIGSVLSALLDTPETVRELTIEVSEHKARVKAWCGGSASSSGRLTSALRSIVEHVVDGRLWGSWRYRVVRMSSDRVELQSVRRVVGLPDILPIAMWAGVAGAHAELTPGTEVLVEFVEGDRAQPAIRAFAPKAGPSFAPVELHLVASTVVKLGDESATDFVALASKVDALASAFNAHTHVDPQGGSTAIPTGLYTGGPSGAVKVKAA